MPVQRWDLGDLAKGVKNLGTGLVNAGKAVYATASAKMDERSRTATGAQAHEYLTATPIIRRFVEAQARSKNLAAPGTIQFDDDFTFTWQYIDFAVQLEVKNAERDGREPKVDATMAEATEHVKNVAGFTWDDVIHVRQERARASTVIHESIHLYAADSFRARAGKQPDEGLTEYFTRMVCTANAITRSNVYPQQLAATEKLQAKLPRGDEALTDALFGGDMNHLRYAFDPPEGSTEEKVAEGHRRFKQWRTHMRAKEFDAANAILD